jgi:hypothetical protein
VKKEEPASDSDDEKPLAVRQAKEISSAMGTPVVKTEATTQAA